MLRNTLNLITILISTLAFTQQKLQSHSTDFNIKGKVKSFTSTTKNYKSINDLVKDSDILFVQNDPNFTSEYYFNEDGFLYESKTDEVGYTWKKYEFSKAKKPLVIKISVLKKDKISAEYIPNYTIDITYQNESSLVTTNYSNGKKEVIQRYLDKKGNVIKEHLVPKTKKVFTYSYDEKNNMVEKKKNEEFYSKNTYQYDNEGNISQKIETHKSGSFHTFNYEKGLLTSILLPEGDIQTFTYEFDSKGNWTKRTTKMNDILVSEDFRVYEY